MARDIGHFAQDDLPLFDLHLQGVNSDDANLEFDMNAYQQQQPEEGPRMPSMRNSPNQHQWTHSPLGKAVDVEHDLIVSLGEQSNEAGWHESPPLEQADFLHMLGAPQEEDDAPAGWQDNILRNRTLGDVEPPFWGDMLDLSQRTREEAEKGEAAGGWQSITRAFSAVLDKVDNEGQVGLEESAGISARSPFSDFQAESRLHSSWRIRCMYSHCCNRNRVQVDDEFAA